VGPEGRRGGGGGVRGGCGTGEGREGRRKEETKEENASWGGEQMLGVGGRMLHKGAG